MVSLIIKLWSKKNQLRSKSKAIRPWQHVLEPSSYLLLAQKMWEDQQNIVKVGILDRMNQLYLFGMSQKKWFTVWKRKPRISSPDALHEAKLLMLDINKAAFELSWEPKMNINQCIALTIDWYKRYKSESVWWQSYQ